MNYYYYYAIAQICRNGHLRNINASEHPESNEKFCSQCNAGIISECPTCHSAIRGAHIKAMNYDIPAQEHYDPLNDYDNCPTKTITQRETLTNDYTIPAYCYHCGEPYPWTESFLKAANEMVDLFDELSLEQKELLKTTFPDLITETPSSELSALKFSKIVSCLNEFSKDVLARLLKDHALDSIFLLLNLSRP